MNLFQNKDYSEYKTGMDEWLLRAEWLGNMMRHKEMVGK